MSVYTDAQRQAFRDAGGWRQLAKFVSMVVSAVVVFGLCLGLPLMLFGIRWRTALGVVLLLALPLAFYQLADLSEGPKEQP